MESYKGFNLWDLVVIKPGKLGKELDELAGQITGFFTAPDVDDRGNLTKIIVQLSEPLENNICLATNKPRERLIVNAQFLMKWEEYEASLLIEDAIASPKPIIPEQKTPKFTSWRKGK